MKRNRVHHTVISGKIPRRMTLAVAADLHCGRYEDVLEDLRGCDAILLPGDLVNRHRRSYAGAERFLREAPGIAPVFYSMGNHERKCAFREEWMQLVKKSDVVWLDDESVLFEGIRIGGLSSRREGKADTGFLDRLEAAEEFINSLSREGTVCVYVVTGYNDYGPRALTSVERYVVWNDRDRYAALEGNRRAAG